MPDTLANTQGRVREWIGPRIIPVFADNVQWDSNTNYEPLMMVQNAGETFMSRQYVPAGAPLPDTSSGQESTDYWVHMSNWNAQVEAYREEVMQYARTVLGFSGDIEDLQNALPIADFDEDTTVKDAIDAINTAINAINTAINAINGDIDTIDANGWVSTNRIADGAVATANIADGAVTSAKIADGAVKLIDLEKPAMVIFGDSWSSFPTYENWVEYAGIPSILNCDIINNAVGGAGFTGGSSLVSSQVTNAASSMSANDKTRTKWVVIAAGTNDFKDNGFINGNYSSWLSAIRGIITDVHTLLPHAKIYFAPTICSVDKNKYRCKYTYAACMRLVDDLRWSTNVTFVNNMPYFWIGHTCSEVFRADNIHLNSSGGKAFGNTILNAILGNNAVYTCRQRFFLSSDSNVPIIATMTPYSIKISGDGVTLPDSVTTLYNTQNQMTEALEIMNMADSLDDNYNRVFVASSGNADKIGWLRHPNDTFQLIGRGASTDKYYFGN